MSPNTSTRTAAVAEAVPSEALPEPTHPAIHPNLETALAAITSLWDAFPGTLDSYEEALRACMSSDPASANMVLDGLSMIPEPGRLDAARTEFSAQFRALTTFRQELALLLFIKDMCTVTGLLSLLATDARVTAKQRLELAAFIIAHSARLPGQAMLEVVQEAGLVVIEGLRALQATPTTPIQGELTEPAPIAAAVPSPVPPAPVRTYPVPVPPPNCASRPHPPAGSRPRSGDRPDIQPAYTSQSQV